MSLDTKPEGKLATTNITNALVRALRGNVTAELGIVSLPFGITNSLIGQILPEGPEGELDFTDNRYWVRCCATKISSFFADPAAHPEIQIAHDQQGDSDEDGTIKPSTILVVTNLAEQWGFPFELDPRAKDDGNQPVSFPGPHGLPPGAFIQFGVTTDAGDEELTKFRYVTFTVPKLQCLIEVTSPDTGNGVYLGFECNAPTNDIVQGANATINGTVGKRNPFSCRVVNFREFGSTGHEIDPLWQPTVFLGYLLRVNRDGTVVYGADMQQEQRGQYQGMVKQMVTDLAVGFDRVRGRALL